MLQLQAVAAREAVDELDRHDAQQHGQNCPPPWQCPSSAPAGMPPQGAPGSSGWLSAPTGETGPPGAQPLPRVLELAASKTADFPRP